MLCRRYVIEDAEVHVQYQDFRFPADGKPARGKNASAASVVREQLWRYENSLGGTISGEANDYDYDLVNAVNSRNTTSIAGCHT